MALNRVVIAGLALLAVAVACAGGIAEGMYQYGLGTPLSQSIPLVGQAVVGASWAATGAALAWLRPRNILGWLMLGVGTIMQLSLAAENLSHSGAFRAFNSGVVWDVWIVGMVLATITGFSIIVLMGLLPVLYPTGTWPGKVWIPPTVVLVVGAALLQTYWTLDMIASTAPNPAPPNSAELAAPPEAVNVLFPAMVYAAGLVWLWGMCWLRLIRAVHPERQQLAWLLVSVVLLMGTQFLGGTVPGQWLLTISLYLLPVAVAVGVLRYRLLGIQALLRRGLVYALLTACIMAAYGVVLAVAGLHLTGDPLAAVVVAALVTVGLSPLRNILQRTVDLFLYGRGADPIAAVSGLGALAAGAADHELLLVVATGIKDAVRAPYVRIARLDGGTLASAGGPAAVEPVFTAPLSLGGRHVGTLELEGRTPGERYPARDERLLRAMAPQLAAVVHALSLTAELARQHDAVLAATARERERLRRDLHDGLGPSLTGVGLGLAALGDAVSGEPAELVHVLEREVASSVTEVRRILDGLLPEVLARRGLAGVLPGRLAAVAGQLECTVRVEPLPPLPAAVEEAVYNITSEAVANVTRHAGAHKVLVSLSACAGLLCVSVDDDGTGFPDHPTDGIGLASMQARAVALGGSMSIASSAAGASLRFTLPLTMDLQQPAPAGSPVEDSLQQSAGLTPVFGGTHE